jgi:beta-galactosidase
LHDLKVAFAPAHIAIASDLASVTITNRYDFVDTSHLAFEWSIASSTGVTDHGSLSVPAIPARSSAVVELPAAAKAAAEPGRVLTISVNLANQTAWAQAGHELAWAQRSSVTAPIPAATSAAKTTLTPAAATNHGTIAVGNVVLDAETGDLTRLGNIDVADWRLELWRAPTDNDKGSDWRDRAALSAAALWELHGLDRLISRVVSIEHSNGAATVVTRVGSAVMDGYVELECSWTATNAGVRLDVTAQPHYEYETLWARFGLSFTVPGEFETVDWFGRGPGSGYPDTGQATRLGWFESTVDAMQIPRPRPQEDGARRDVRWASVASAKESVEITGEPFSLTVRPWSTETLARTTHLDELESDGRTHIVLDHLVRGIGTASVRVDVLPEYELSPRPATFSLLFAARS